ncbi:MAG: hypothetical protein AAF493_20560, partial [Pseudomonadota bacterium]
LGEQLVAVGENELAQDQFDQVLQQLPNHAPAMIGLAMLYGANDQRALPLARHATQIESDNAAITFQYGQLLGLANDARAVSVLARASELDPDDLSIRKHLAAAQRWQRGEFNTFIEALNSSDATEQ